MTNQKRLGQYFLTNKIKLQEIVDALDLKPGDIVIEIGPGHGELTESLKSQISNLKIIAIEKDEELVRCLQKKFAQDKNIEIIEGDALKEIKNQISKIQNTNQISPPQSKTDQSRVGKADPPRAEKIIKNLKIAGNIPYYITGFLLRILGELEIKPSLIVLTVQKEVTERICAQPFGSAQGKPQMNLLAASVQFWAEPKIIDYIPKTDFKPQPKVDSAIIKLKSITISMRPSTKCYEIRTEKYYKLIKILFKQPRKTILNNLASSVVYQTSNGKTKEGIIKILEELKINPGDRPQNLSIEQIKEIAKRLKS